ncbi:hypothetical protein [Nonomuraea dietziae]
MGLLAEAPGGFRAPDDRWGEAAGAGGVAKQADVQGDFDWPQQAPPRA